MELYLKKIHGMIRSEGFEIWNFYKFSFFEILFNEGKIQFFSNRKQDTFQKVLEIKMKTKKQNA